MDDLTHCTRLSCGHGCYACQRRSRSCGAKGSQCLLLLITSRGELTRFYHRSWLLTAPNSFSSLGCCVCSVLGGFDITHLPEVQYPTSFIFFWIAQSSTSLLFLLRIRAVYSHSILVQYGFFALWIIITVSPTLILLGPGVHCELANPHPHGYRLILSRLS